MSIKMTEIEFERKARLIHGDKYDYSKVICNGSRVKVIIICPKHGEFEITPAGHLNKKRGCLKCSYECRWDFRQDKITTETFIEKSILVHGNKYDYSKVKYVNNRTKVVIICPTHGEFKQSPDGHLHGSDCLFCGFDKTGDKLRSSTKEFIEKAREIHGDKYDYSKVEYNQWQQQIIIICPTHGEFKQIPNAHLNKCGCPKCSTIISKGHEEMSDYIKSLGFDVTDNDRKQIKPLELDIWIPEKRVAIEFNGMYWHSYDKNETTEERRKHLYKTEQCEENDIFLIQIYDYEWKNQKDIVKSLIKSKLGVTERIFARKTEVREVNVKDNKEFLNKAHMQGTKMSNAKYGLYFNDELVSLMTFNKHKLYEWEITRFANKEGITVVGGASKLFKHFLKTVKPSEVMSFADRRWSQGGLYKNLGFELIEKTECNYKYIKGKKVYTRQQFMKHKLKDKLETFNQNLTEHQNMFNNGYRRLWDCGNLKYIYKS